MPRCPTRASGSRRRKPSTIPRPARRTGTIATSPSRRLPLAGSSGVSTVTSRVGRSRVASIASIAEASSSARRKAPCGVARSRRTTRRSARTGCSTTVSRSAIGADPRMSPGGAACRLQPVMAPPRRNVELKARDPDPERSLARARALGAEDRGELRQRDTYFDAPSGRLKLREQEPGGAELIAYERVEGLGDFVELEGVADASSDLAREAGLVARLREELAIADEAVEATGYADLLAGVAAVEPGAAADAASADGAEELLRAAEAAMRRAHAPYSRFPVGAALRTADGAIHTAANVENAAYPQGQCAEASAIGVMIAAGSRE